MKNVGIVTEYNPFHLGHRRQIDALRARFGAECGIVCCMSGNFVQRGEPALLDKWKRAELALRGGADLVLELPTLWAVSSAQTFARGAVEVLTSAGVADILAFGSECGDLETLRRVSDCLESAPYRESLREGLDRGSSFAAARERAVRACVGKAADCLRAPNDILAVEYLSALSHLGSALEPLPLKRTGAGHDGGAGEDGTASASHIRMLLRASRREEALAFLPEGTEEALRDAPLSDPARLDRAVLARLRTMEEADWAALPDCGEGLHRRLQAAARQAGTVEELLERAATRRYPAPRIRRAVLWAFLGLSAADRPEKVPYLRVLGFSGRGQGLLRQMKTRAGKPVITKPAHGRRLEGDARRVLEGEARCTDLYDLTLPAPGPCGREWRQDPVRV